jgi:hypothetical protein
VNGLENAPKALLRLFSDENFGRTVQPSEWKAQLFDRLFEKNGVRPPMGK